MKPADWDQGGLTDRTKNAPLAPKPRSSAPIVTYVLPHPSRGMHRYPRLGAGRCEADLHLRPAHCESQCLVHFTRDLIDWKRCREPTRHFVNYEQSQPVLVLLCMHSSSHSIFSACRGKGDERHQPRQRRLIARIEGDAPVLHLVYGRSSGLITGPMRPLDQPPPSGFPELTRYDLRRNDDRPQRHARILHCRVSSPQVRSYSPALLFRQDDPGAPRVRHSVPRC